LIEVIKGLSPAAQLVSTRLAPISLGSNQFAVIVAVVDVRMMNVPIYQVVFVITVRYCRMTAAIGMHVARVVGCACVAARTCIRVAGINSYGMLVDMITMDIVQMAVMQEVDVIVVFHR
jgi:hypothetical protein